VPAFQTKSAALSATVVPGACTLFQVSEKIGSHHLVATMASTTARSIKSGSSNSHNDSSNPYLGPQRRLPHVQAQAAKDFHASPLKQLGVCICIPMHHLPSTSLGLAQLRFETPQNSSSCSICPSSSANSYARACGAAVAATLMWHSFLGEQVIRSS